MAGLLLVHKNSAFPAQPNTALMPKTGSSEPVYDPSDSYYGIYESGWPDEMVIGGEIISCVTDPISCWEENHRKHPSSADGASEKVNKYNLLKGLCLNIIVK